MSLRRTVPTIAALVLSAGGLTLGGAAAASTGKPPTPATHPPSPCGGAVVQALTTSLSGSPAAMTLDVTLNHDVGRVVGAVGGADGVLEYGPLAPVTGQAGSYSGVFSPPSGAPVADGDRVLVIGCENHWLAAATVGTDWAPGSRGPGDSKGSGDDPTSSGGQGPGSTPPVTTAASGCVGAQVSSVTSALTADGTGVTVTITVNQSLGRNFSSAVESGGQIVAEGVISEVAGQPGTYEGTLTSTSGTAIPAGSQVVFGSCGGTPNRIGGTTAVGSSTWSPLA